MNSEFLDFKTHQLIWSLVCIAAIDLGKPYHNARFKVKPHT